MSSNVSVSEVQRWFASSEGEEVSVWSYGHEIGVFTITGVYPDAVYLRQDTDDGSSTVKFLIDDLLFRVDVQADGSDVIVPYSVVRSLTSFYAHVDGTEIIRFNLIIGADVTSEDISE